MYNNRQFLVLLVPVGWKRWKMLKTLVVIAVIPGATRFDLTTISDYHLLRKKKHPNVLKFELPKCESMHCSVFLTCSGTASSEAYFSISIKMPKPRSTWPKTTLVPSK